MTNGKARNLIILNKDNYLGGLYQIKDTMVNLEELIQMIEHEIIPVE